MTLGTGYLCVGCHGSATNEHVFAVNERGATPAIHYTANPWAPGEHAAEGNVTGHQVWIGASSNWSNPGTWYSGGGAHDYYLAVYKYVIDGVERWFKVTSGHHVQRGRSGRRRDRTVSRAGPPRSPLLDPGRMGGIPRSRSTPRTVVALATTPSVPTASSRSRTAT